MIRQDRFLRNLQRGGSLLFSFTNALEVTGPQGDTAAAVRAFLQRVGPYWVPCEINPFKVAKGESLGFGSRSPISKTFIEAYLRERANELSPSDEGLLNPSAGFLDLSRIMDWLEKDRVELEGRKEQIYNALLQRIAQLRANYEQRPDALDEEMPSLPFDSLQPATFVLNHLLRGLVRRAKEFTLKRNDAIDFCHAVVAAAYGSVATLDKQWKRRVEELPKPNGLAKIYYPPEIDQFLDELDGLVSAREGSREGAPHVYEDLR
ncbi:MAG TPA: hypothetical protein VJ805_12170 [Nitrospiraceae bacterium]|nr:hypothetical protein [Nitrospiraceae bacterium]